MPKTKTNKSNKDKRKNSGNLRTWSQKKGDTKRKKK